MLNNVILIGRLTTDVILKETQNGKAYTDFTLAVERDFKVDNQPNADFINIKAWAKLAETITKYCAKGHLICVKGRIQTYNFNDNEGKKVYVTQVIADGINFLNNKAKPENTEQYTNKNEEVTIEEIQSDDLPF